MSSEVRYVFQNNIRVSPELHEVFFYNLYVILKNQSIYRALYEWLPEHLVFVWQTLKLLLFILCCNLIAQKAL